MPAAVSSRQGIDASRTSRLLLTVGLLAFAVAVIGARQDQATGYELSIYAATTPVFWVGVAVATIAGVVAAFADTGWIRGLGIGLATASMFAVIALPFLRGYHFYGQADPLTHLGWARQLAAEGIAPTDILYPGIHSGAVFLAELANVPVRRALLLTTISFTLVFVVFVALTVEMLAPQRPYALSIGALSALLLLPINHISMFLRTHPFSQSTMYAALVVFALVVYVRRVDAGPVRGLFTPEGAVLSLAAAASTIYHPQLAADLLVVFAVVCAVQFLVRWRADAGGIADHAPLYGPTAVLAAAFGAWVLPSEWFFGTIERHSASLVLLLQGQPPEFGDRVAGQSASLLAIGASPLEVFLKLFVPSTVFLAVAGLFVLALLRGRVRTSEGTAATTYLVAGAVVAGGLVVVYFVSSVSEMYFRHLGLLMLFVTVLGAVGLVHWLSSSSATPTSRTLRVAVVVLFLAMLPLTAAVAYQSPYIYKANQHVTDQQMSGYETTFEAGDGDYPVASVRQGARRYHESLYGESASGPPLVTVQGEELPALRSTFADGGYLVLTDQEVQRETRAYRQLRYKNHQFDAVDGQPGVNRVSTNGEARTYFVPEAES